MCYEMDRKSRMFRSLHFEAIVDKRLRLYYLNDSDPAIRVLFRALETGEIHLNRRSRNDMGLI